MKQTDFKIFPTQITHYRNFLSDVDIDSLRRFCMSYETGSHNMLTGNGRCSSGSERPLNYNDNILEGFKIVGHRPVNNYSCCKSFYDCYCCTSDEIYDSSACPCKFFTFFDLLPPPL